MDLLAAATIALAIATVFGKEIRSWLIKPRIRLYGDITARYVVRSPNEWLDNLERGLKLLRLFRRSYPYLRAK